jgi:hypothetical protein
MLEDYLRVKGYPNERIDGRIRGNNRQVGASYPDLSYFTTHSHLLNPHGVSIPRDAMA